MADAQGVALALEGAALGLATISLPLAAAGAAGAPAAQAEDECNGPPLLPAPLPPSFAALAAALAAVRALATPELPFAAVAGDATLRVVCQRAKVADVFKLLRSKQAALGVQLRDVKSCVSLTPPGAEELSGLAGAAVAAALRAHGWWQADEERLLGANPYEPAPDGATRACESVRLSVHVEPPAEPRQPPRLLLLVLPEVVEFRHPACRPDATLEGAELTLLPNLRPAMAVGARPADAATLATLRPLWAAHGHPLPAEVPTFVEVVLEDDPDAPTFPYPPCRLLGHGGLQCVASRRSAPGVQAVLARLRDDLAATPFKLLGQGLKVGAAFEWYPEGPPQQQRGRQAAAKEESPLPPPPLVFMTARQHEAAQKEQLQQTQAQQAQGVGTASQLPADQAGPFLGPKLDVAAWKAAAQVADADGKGAMPLLQARQRRQYAPPDPKLQAAFVEAKRLQAEAGRPAGAASATQHPTQAAAKPAGAVAAKLAPLALRQAAAAAAGGSVKPAAPVFKKIARAGASAAPKKAAAGAKRAAGAAKPPAAPKRPKAGAAAAATAPGAAPTAQGVPAAAEAAAPSAAKPAAARSKAHATTAAAAGGMGAAATAALASAATEAGTAAGAPAAKAPAKPRAKPAEIDLAAVTAKVQQLHAAGTLGKLTIPEMKAYLKSLRQPVGGKKGELEERVRQSLGGVAAAPAGA
ncbi:hypothetical protein C2E20_3898 [Micractinium conductrix]|uniref:SAP domain-containing protein n=1 Tax=Micractinium conductrix TaxID=554055 RepID=A0A2P6VFP9_9CHLO|nr:hypothetical protein C2E20_3898 [Micractinium conductrix]|eukprot:PSC72899.1 hypothetical protein C2E20_3898 [Micractinium conductrix]